ncbi:MAG: hypothetical protein ABIT38_18710 [Gemmatimonadaceae bacterium]
MPISLRRHRAAALGLATTAALLLVACGDSRVRGLEFGMTKDSVLKVISQGAPAGDSLPNVYKYAQYFVDGKMFDVYFFEPKGRKAWKDPDVTDRELTPIVLVDGKLEGTGWSYMDGLTAQYKVPGRTTPR